MPQDTRLSDDLEALAERNRRRLGDAPTVEQLAALRAGELPPEEAERLRDRLAVDPESAAIFLGLAEAEAAEAPSVDIDGAWREFSAKANGEPGAAGSRGQARGDIVPFRRRAPYRVLLGLAALLVLGVGLKFFWLDLDPGADGPFHAVRVTGETFRGTEIEVPAGFVGVEFQIVHPEVRDAVVAELLDSSQKLVQLQRVTVEAGQEGVRFRVSMTKLEAGRSYQLLVRREGSSATEEPLIDFRFELELDVGG